MNKNLTFIGPLATEKTYLAIAIGLNQSNINDFNELILTITNVYAHVRHIKRTPKSKHIPLGVLFVKAIYINHSF
ncbi:hypothetical protein ACAG39_06265 [Caldicellulosiruptoraceae bacterium PP1]